MKPSILSLMIMAITLNAFSQQRTVIHLWRGKVPGEDGAKHVPVITPDTSKGVIRITDITDPVLTVYKPDTPNNTGAGIIVCPGGGYQILALNLEGKEIAEWLNKLGYTAFVLQYRVPKKQAGALQDVQRAI